MKFSAHLDAIPASVYSKLGALAQAAPSYYPLHVGDTYRAPPAGCHLTDLSEAEIPGLHRYTPVDGLPALREAILEVKQADLGAFGPDNLLVTGGATMGLASVAMATIDPGDEVILTSPHWPLIAGSVRVVGGVVKEAPLYGVVQTAEEAVAAFEAQRTDRTVAIYLNTPSNPTGLLAPRAWLEAIAAWARQHDLWIWSDEVYEDYAWGAAHVYARPLAPERTISVHSFSKAYGMAGNRCGYLVGPAEAVSQIRKVSIHTLYDAPTGGQWAATRALLGPGKAWAEEARGLYAEVGARAAERLGVAAPEGGTFLFVDASEALDERGLNGLLEDIAHQGVLVAPGTSFGPWPHHIRICFTSIPADRVMEGIEIVARRLGR